MIVTTTPPNPASPRHWQVQVATTVQYCNTPVSLLIDCKRIMPAAVWLPTEGPNLVGSIFKKGETEDMQRKTERFGYLESEVLYCM